MGQVVPLFVCSELAMAPRLGSVSCAQRLWLFLLGFVFALLLALAGLLGLCIGMTLIPQGLHCTHTHTLAMPREITKEKDKKRKKKKLLRLET